MSQSDKPRKKPTESIEPTEDLTAQIAVLTDALQRERADAMNVRRHAEEDRQKAASYHKAAVVRALLPVIDNFERALKHVPGDLEGNDYIKGISSVITQFEKVLEDLGVKRIETVGKPFDPTYHEAVAMEDADGQAGATEMVSEELQSGYILDGEVLRHAMVKVTLQ